MSLLATLPNSAFGNSLLSDSSWKAFHGDMTETLDSGYPHLETPSFPAWDLDRKRISQCRHYFPMPSLGALLASFSCRPKYCFDHQSGLLATLLTGAASAGRQYQFRVSGPLDTLPGRKSLIEWAWTVPLEQSTLIDCWISAFHCLGVLHEQNI